MVYADDPCDGEKMNGSVHAVQEELVQKALQVVKQKQKSLLLTESSYICCREQG